VRTAQGESRCVRETPTGSFPMADSNLFRKKITGMCTCNNAAMCALQRCHSSANCPGAWATAHSGRGACECEELGSQDTYSADSPQLTVACCLFRGIFKKLVTNLTATSAVTVSDRTLGQRDSASVSAAVRPECDIKHCIIKHCIPSSTHCCTLKRA
jgi:hypothetical protein